MAFDFKKEYKEFYLPPQKPTLIEVLPINYLAVRGKGDPNEEDGEYNTALGLLYAIAYTLKMSHKSTHKISGFYEYVVPPLEGFWWQEGIHGVDYSRKEAFSWISVIRLPDFVTRQDFEWAIKEATHKKKTDYSQVEWFEYNEGACVQSMHIGPYETEPETVEKMHVYAASQGFTVDISDTRLHHEIYLGDPRKTDPAKLKTVVRHPIRKTL